MATSEFWQNASASAAVHDWAPDATEAPPRSSQAKVTLWMFVDFLTILISAIVATIYQSLL